MKRSKWQTPLKGGDEHDAISGWRRVLRFRPGERKAAKRKFNRRVRQMSKPDHISQEDWDAKS